MVWEVAIDFLNNTAVVRTSRSQLFASVLIQILFYTKSKYFLWFEPQTGMYVYVHITGMGRVVLYL